jgi:hypothetical protein
MRLESKRVRAKIILKNPRIRHVGKQKPIPRPQPGRTCHSRHLGRGGLNRWPVPYEAANSGVSVHRRATWSVHDATVFPAALMQDIPAQRTIGWVMQAKDQREP